MNEQRTHSRVAVEADDHNGSATSKVSTRARDVGLKEHAVLSRLISSRPLPT